MNRNNSLRRGFAGWVAVLGIVLFSGCIYEVPITLDPTRKAEDRLIGNWFCAKENETMSVRKLDDSIYLIAYGKDLFRGWHSDLDGVAFVSVQDLNRKERKYAYFTYRLEEDGGLTIRVVNPERISQETKSVADVQALLRQHADEQDLFLDEVSRFTKEARDE
jgi:hypothetical protein